jgi:hypothetical protein
MLGEVFKKVIMNVSEEVFIIECFFIHLEEPQHVIMQLILPVCLFVQKNPFFVTFSLFSYHNMSGLLKEDIFITPYWEDMYCMAYHMTLINV